jgi:uncharacterized membrane protein
VTAAHALDWPGPGPGTASSCGFAWTQQLHRDDAMRTKIGISTLAERWRGSLFVVPMTFVIGAIVLAEIGIAVDRSLGSGTMRLPLGLTSTVASARSVLSTVAGATITVAGIAFSVSLLTIQLASSQYSPRVVSGLFRDPFNKRVIGIVVGTFTYCLVVLRSVRSAIEQQGQPVVPNVSVAAAVLFGITAVLAIIAFINHNAHAMDISEILDDVTRDAIDAVERHWSSNVLEPSPVQQPEVVPEGAGLEVTFDRDGWVQLLDHDRLVGLVPDSGTLRFETAVGRYVISGSPLCTLWPRPADGQGATKEARAAVHVGQTRTLQQDASFGIRQLADVALKALSPGVNDPTTAQDAIFHVASVLRAFLEHDPPAQDVSRDGRRCILAQADGYEQLIGVAFDEVRIAAAPYPSVLIYLLESIALLQRALVTTRDDVARILGDHASLILHAAVGAGLSRHDLGRVEHIYDQHFERPWADSRIVRDGFLGERAAR